MNKDQIINEIDATDMPECFINSQISNEQFNFIKNKTKKLVSEGSKIKKNDIYDLFFIYSFSNFFVSKIENELNVNFPKDKIILLTFDKDLMNEIEKFSPQSKVIIDSYRY